jgi:hypothetical protein
MPTSLTRRSALISAFAYGAAARAGPIPTVVSGADDTAALNAALDRGGLIQLEARIYRVDAPHDVLTLRRSNTTLRGAPGSVIECGQIYAGQSTADIALLSISRPGAILTNIALDGVTVRFAAPFPALGAKPVIYAQQVRDFHMSNCTVQNGSYGMFLRQVEDFEITGCLFVDTRADGLQGGNMGSQTLGMTIKNGVVENNTFRRTGDDAIAFGGQIHSNWTLGANVRIARNTIQDMPRFGGGIGVYGMSDVTVEDNVITNPASHGIAVVTDTNNAQLNNENIKITGNRIHSDRPPTDPARVAIALANRDSHRGRAESAGPMLRNCLVENNDVSVSDRGGLRLSLARRYDWQRSRFPTDLTIRNNRLIFTGPTWGAPPYEGLHIDGCDSIALSRNEISGFPGGQTLFRRVRDLKT